MTSGRIWKWSGLQRRHDALMNAAYVKAARKLVTRASSLQPAQRQILDVGCGSGLILRMLHETIKGYAYTGIDVSSDGLELLETRARKLGIRTVTSKKMSVVQFDPVLEKRFDTAYSNFCLYTVRDPVDRQRSLENIRRYLTPGGWIHLGLPTEIYNAESIYLECIKAELENVGNGAAVRLTRAFLLTFYQWRRVLRPIESRINSGEFVRFSLDQIVEELTKSGFEVHATELAYGGCGYHVHATAR